MFRTWLTWGLSSTLLYTACGGGNENELFGNVKAGSGGSGTSIEPSLGEVGGNSEGSGTGGAGKSATGGRAVSSGGQSDPPAATGGQDVGGGGASSPGGVAGEPSAGTNEPGA